MTIRLEAIRSNDTGSSAQLGMGDLVEYEVDLDVDGARRTFRVFSRANVRPGFDASLLYGDPLLEELLRFEPRALSVLYRSVGKHGAGTSVELPLVLVDSDDDEAQRSAKAPTA